MPIPTPAVARTPHPAPPTRPGRAALRLAGALLAAALLSGCSLIGAPSAPGESRGAGPESGADTAGPLRELTVVTHDSFHLSEAVLKRFTEQSGYTVTFVAPGDAGALVNQLILTKDAPLGDVVYGVDNTFAGRALDAGIFADYDAPGLASAARAERVNGSAALTPIDRADVCLNADKQWFERAGTAIPSTLKDLTKPEYRDDLVLTSPASSSPGLAFLLATVAEFGADGWPGYWAQLKANGVRVVDGWETAYNVDFSGSGGKGPRPLVLSYSSSPAAEVAKGAKESRTVALLDTCFRQVEYAGVLAGASNPDGAKAFIDFMLTDAVQQDLPGQMYVYPINPGVPLPEDWARFAPLSPNPKSVDPSWLGANRDQLIKDWSRTVVG